MSTTTRRVFVGGLAPSVTEVELTDRFQRFGQVSNLQLKSKTVKDMPTRTFAHMDLTGPPSKLTQCMSAYNNCQWKGHRMTIQWAKDNFLDKLKTEVAERKKPKEKEKVEESPPKRRIVAGAKPGQPVPGEKESDWVVAKFGMALPVLNHKSKDNRRVLKIDPSKFTHCLKRMKDGDGDVDNDVSKLTWTVTGDSKLAKLQEKSSRKRKISPKVTKTVQNGETNNTFEDGRPHAKIAKLKLAEKCHFENEKRDNIEASSDSDDDSQVFSRRKSNKILNTGSNLKGNEVAKYSIKSAKTQSPGMKVTIRKDTVKYDSESEPDSDDSFTICKKAKTEPLSSNLNPSPIPSTNPQPTTTTPSSTKKTVSAKSASSSKTNSTNQRRKSAMTPLPVISFLSDGESDDSRGSGDTDEIIRQGKKRQATPIVLKHGKIIQVSEFGSGLAKFETKARTQTIRERVNVPDKSKSKPEIEKKSESEESSSDKSETNKTASSPSKNVPKGCAISTMTLVEDSQLSTSASSQFSDGNEMDKSSDEETDSSDSEDEAAALNKSLLTAPKHVVKARPQQLKSKQTTRESEQIETRSSDESSEETDDGESEEQTPTPAGPGKVKVKVKVSAKSTVTESTSSEESSGNSEEIESMKSISTTGSRERLSEEAKSESEASSSSDESSQDESESELKPVSPQKNIINSVKKPAMDSESASSSNEDSGEESVELDSSDSSKQSSQSETSLTPTTKAVEAEEEDSTDSEDEAEEYDGSGAENVAKSPRQVAKDFFDTSSEEETDTSAEVVEKVTDLIEKAKNASMNSDTTTTKATLKTNKNEKKVSADKSSSLTKTTKTAPDSTKPETDLKAEDSTLEATKTKKKEKKEKQTVEGAKPQTKLEKHKSDNEKRLESVRQKEAAVRSQKRAIQEALAKLDAGGSSMNKKIKFDSDSDSDDDEDEEMPASTEIQNVAKGATLPEKSDLSKGSRSDLFSGSSGSDDEDSDSDDRFRIRPQFQGKDGQKLMKLQSSYKDDARFKLDDRFVDPDAQSGDQSEDEEEKEEEEAKNELSEEKHRNLRILEAVMGKSVANVGQKPKAAFREPVRYDPTKDDHQEYLVKEKNEDKKKKKKEKAPSKSVEDSPVPTVSKDTFYAVETDMLKSVIVDKKSKSEESTKKPGAVFNFLFDDDDDLQIDDEKDDDSRIEAASTSSSKSNVFLGEKNPFKYDSSSESDNEQDMDDVTTPSDDVSGDVKAPKTEPFFFVEDDPRIKEGIETFHAHEDPDEVRRQWLERREGLIELYKSLKRKRRAHHRVNLSRNQSKRGGHKAR